MLQSVIVSGTLAVTVTGLFLQKNNAFINCKIDKPFCVLNLDVFVIEPNVGKKSSFLINGVIYVV